VRVKTLYDAYSQVLPFFRSSPCGRSPVPAHESTHVLLNKYVLCLHSVQCCPCSPGRNSHELHDDATVIDGVTHLQPYLTSSGSPALSCSLLLVHINGSAKHRRLKVPTPEEINPAAAPVLFSAAAHESKHAPLNKYRFALHALHTSPAAVTVQLWHVLSMPLVQKKSGVSA